MKKQFDVLECHKCQKRYHAGCHEPPLNASLVKKQRQSSEKQSALRWECPDCKVCEMCHSASDENKIIICEMCDIAVHIHCLSPPLSKVPSKSWYCDSCSVCLSCKIRLPSPIANYEAGKWNKKSTSPLAGTQRLCEKCYDCYKQGNFCSLCHKAYEDDCEDNFVGCDQCEGWVHAECEGISPEDFAKIDKDTKFVCSNCKK